MTLVIEAFELDKKTNIAYSHRIELAIGNYVSNAKVERAVDICVREVRNKQKVAKEFEKTVPGGGESERQQEG